jgi:hypothetical protein
MAPDQADGGDAVRESIILQGIDYTLAERLEQQGGQMVLQTWPSLDDSMTLTLFLPDDQDAAKVCRQLVADWQAAHPEP